MKIINWNISCMKGIFDKIDYLREIVNDQSFVIILQEVKYNSYKEIQTAFQDVANIEYSLHYRAPGKYDTDSRKLGIAILVSRDIKILSAQVLDRALMPDRTLLVDVEYGKQNIRILGLHSVTGCQHLKAKEIQYFSFAEAVDEFKPDIVGIDANEPKVDHYDTSKMIFFDNYNKGKGCKIFFESMKANGLTDSFIKNYDKRRFVLGEYLTTSYIIKRGNKRVRYDFLFVNDKKIGEYSCKYEYEQAIKAGSDHAAVILEIMDD